MTLVLLLTCVLTPYNIAFQKDDSFLNTAVDILFGMDMIVAFNTVFYDLDMNVIDDRK